MCFTKDGLSAKDIGAITSYNQYVALIRSRVPDTAPGGVEVSSVDGFLGLVRTCSVHDVSRPLQMGLRYLDHMWGSFYAI